MPGLGDNLKRWRDVAEVDWFSQFIKAWIPFNAWMTDTFGDLSDRELLDKVKGTSNVVKNKTLPMISRNLRVARDAESNWQDDSGDAQQFRLQIGELHRRLQQCIVEGRRGRVCFETVDIGANGRKDEQQVKWTRTFRCRRDHPNRGEVSLEISASRSISAFGLTLPSHDRRALEDDATFRALADVQRAVLLALFEAVAPRLVMNVLAEHSAQKMLTYGDVHFIDDSEKNFSALIDVLYGLRNALFHGSITPNDTHNQIYRPAYLIAMRLVKCTL
ncbi:hypothetical protein [Mesorhizobium sp. B1-1-6]|uniref:hypothetical protein n=1 Tax=Mesorhizobium sp. B1-1-6 TaxID=2589978 RepID=UPI00112D2D7D|nr:hypothetical protein [Mesorhizobium sp. B1-1-6]TPN31335.1 hypothetical protein FJ979_28795 [Mesorhizobium sp. B1-1-6]